MHITSFIPQLHSGKWLNEVLKWTSFIKPGSSPILSDTVQLSLCYLWNMSQQLRHYSATQFADTVVSVPFFLGSASVGSGAGVDWCRQSKTGFCFWLLLVSQSKLENLFLFSTLYNVLRAEGPTKVKSMLDSACCGPLPILTNDKKTVCSTESQNWQEFPFTLDSWMTKTVGRSHSGDSEKPGADGTTLAHAQNSEIYSLIMVCNGCVHFLQKFRPSGFSKDDLLTTQKGPN